MRGEDPAAWSRALADPAWLASSQLLKDEPNSSWVRRATINGRDVVVKCRYLNTPSRWLKSALGYGHGDKHWRGAALLASKKIRTAAPIVLARARFDGHPAEVLLLEHLAGPTLLQWLALAPSRTRVDVRREHAVVRAVADQLLNMIESGVFNRDHKPSNLIVLQESGHEPAIAVIDCVGVRRLCGNTARMLAALMIEPIGCGVAPRRALIMRCLSHYWCRVARIDFDDDADVGATRVDTHASWRQVASLIASHGDPRPKTNPLPRHIRPPRSSSRAAAKQP